MAKAISEVHAQRLRERGLDPVLCSKFGVHSSGNAIAFDYVSKGAVHNTKIRHGKGNMPWAEKGKPTILWNLDCLADPPQADEIVIITEGEFDGIACIQAGFTRVVSVPNGAPASAEEKTDNRYAYLFSDQQIRKKLIADLDRFEKIILAVDADGPGRFLRDELAFHLGDHRCFWVDWPDGCKDANDALRIAGPQAVSESIFAARRMWNEQLSTLDDVPDRDVVSFHAGIPNLDLKIVLPEFMVMMGPYGCGKSVFLRQMLWSLWKTHGWRFMLTCLEEPIKPRIQNHFRYLNIGRIRTLWTPEEISEADSEIREAAMFLQRPWSASMTPESFLGFAELAIKRDKVRVIALDPVNELDHEIKRNESQYWSDFIIDCKRLADKYRICFIVCGHPPKEAYKIVASGGVLTAIDMSGSQHWGNKADHSLCFWKPDRFIWGAEADEPLPTLMHLDKSKDHMTMGKPNLYELEHMPYVNRFQIASQGYEMIKRRKKSKKGKPEDE